MSKARSESRWHEWEAAYRADAAGFVERFEQEGGWDAGEGEMRVWAERLRADGWAAPVAAASLQAAAESGEHPSVVSGAGWMLPLVAGTTLFLGMWMLGRPESGRVGNPDRYLPALVPAALCILMGVHGVMGGLGRRSWQVMVPVILLAGWATVGWYLQAWTDDLIPFPLEWNAQQAGDFDRIMGVQQTRVLTLLHLPLGLLGMLGWVYVQGNPQVGRVDFVRHVVQVAIYTGLLFAGGAVLLGLTLSLLDLLHWEQGWEQVGLPLAWWGGISAPFFAHQIWLRHPMALERVLSAMARIFVPLFLVVEAGFLLAFLSRGLDELSADRDQLMVFNLLLLAVVGLLLLQSAWGEKLQPMIRGLLMGLVFLGCVADGVALLAIGRRLWEAGWTPNRFAVLGGNVLLLLTLLAVGVALIRRPDSDLQPLRTTLGHALAAFVGWAFFVALMLPLWTHWRARGIDRTPFMAVPASEVVADPDAEGPAR